MLKLEDFYDRKYNVLESSRLMDFMLTTEDFYTRTWSVSIMKRGATYMCLP